MSAIAGIINLNNEPVPMMHSNSIMESLQKYPADDIQTWNDRNIFLGCHSQWITPEQVGEKLPYYDPDRKLCITADAIIDNREELFNALGVSKALRTNMPDSKLILLAYHNWGEDSPRYLIGDFAFMIWDEREQKLFGARDFSGARTLYYFQGHNSFSFCTTIKPLLALPYVEREINEDWVADYLAIPDMFNSVDLFSTIYNQVNQIPPSHTITVTKLKLSFKKYDHFSSIKKLRLNSNEEYEEAFREVFKEAVDARLRTTKEIGAHLSGGLDSGAVAGFAASSLRDKKKTIKTFSYVPIKEFKDWTPKTKIPDERPFIKNTVEYVGNIRDHYCSFEGHNSYTVVDDWLDTLEMPYKFFENSYWMSGIYREAAKQDISILLNGARGNYTISWGYALDYYTKLLKQFKWISLVKEMNAYRHVKGTGNRKTLAIIRKKAFAKPVNNLGEFKSIPSIIDSEFADKTNVYNRLREHSIDFTGTNLPNTYEARTNQFTKLYYWGNGTSATKLSLRYSLWNRDPTNDLRVIKFCLSLPDSQYIQNGMDRSIVRRATKGILPDKVRLNFKYRGLQGADGTQRLGSHWNELINEFKGLLKNSSVVQYLDENVIKDSLNKINGELKPELIFNHDFKMLMRLLILNRFLIKNSLKEVRK
ncbi:asparagine synthase-related protein [Halobacillus sp. A5]|uniref:asparagine synthase-related protein n=1 Tax=Halobacillus sp. A5 TaxID=2880263 RepID=UPI0020A62124|nr:asparagine synthase-related protein [Halobacillus sp. A5]MCP3029181.1 asparagine synthetase B [Halobacillus sp. A5]